MPILQVMKQEITWDEGNDMLIERSKDSDANRHLLKIELLVNLYFPELIESFDRLLSIRDDLSSARMSAKKAYLNQSGQAAIMNQYSKILRELDTVERDFKKILFTLVPTH